MIEHLSRTGADGQMNGPTQAAQHEAGQPRRERRWLQSWQLPGRHGERPRSVPERGSSIRLPARPGAGRLRLGSHVKGGNAQGQRIHAQVDQSARAEQVEHVLTVRKAQDGAGQVVIGLVVVRSNRLSESAAGRGGRMRDKLGPGTGRAVERTRVWRPCLAAWPRGSSRRFRGRCRERYAGRRQRSPPRSCRWALAISECRPRSMPRGRLLRALRTFLSPSTSISRQKSVPMIAGQTLCGLVIGECEVCRSRAAIKHGNPGFGGHRAGGEPPPGAVDVQAQQMVQQIVPPRDRREHPPHPAVRLVDLDPVATNCRDGMVAGC